MAQSAPVERRIQGFGTVHARNPANDLWGGAAVVIEGNGVKEIHHISATFLLKTGGYSPTGPVLVRLWVVAGGSAHKHIPASSPADLGAASIDDGLVIWNLISNIGASGSYLFGPFDFTKPLLSGQDDSISIIAAWVSTSGSSSDKYETILNVNGCVSMSSDMV